MVRGRLSEHFAGSLGDLELAYAQAESTLTGSFHDQAQLHGLLDRLRDLGIQFVSVNPVQ